MGKIADNINSILTSLNGRAELVAVSKYRPVEELQEAYDAGLRVFAESRPQEFAEKAAVLPDDIQWHFIGHLQTNKIKYVLPKAHLIHSVDSFHLLDAIEAFARAGHFKARVLLEVHVAQEQTKQGFSPGDILSTDWETLQREKYNSTDICGIMGMASNTDDSSRIDADFAYLQAIFVAIRKKYPGMAGFKELSMGMSGDWKTAVEHSATMVRIGSAIFL